MNDDFANNSGQPQAPLFYLVQLEQAAQIFRLRQHS